jgi:hypothetical protein
MPRPPRPPKLNTDYCRQTRAEAKDAVHLLAATVVQWLTSRVLYRR